MKVFAPFHLDDADGTLWRGHEEVPLTRKAGALLRCLVDRAGSPVQKADIMSAVWPDTHVHPDNVKVLVREIRLALHDDSRTPAFIRADAGRGYTFISPVTDTRHGNFVGRSRELAILVDVLDAVRAGSSRVVLIEGEPGTGKSALCEVFVRMTSAASALRSCTGACRPDPPGDERHAPFLQALAHLERQAPALVRAALEFHGLSWLGRVPPAAEEWPAEDRATAGELSELLAKLSRDVPLVIVLEDLQWADLATLDAIDAFSRRRAAGKWLLIGTYCAGAPTAAGGAVRAALSRLSTERGTKTVSLGRLSALQVRRYLDERLGAGRLSSVAPALTAITGGNAGMLVSVVDDLIQQRFVTLGPEGWQAALTPEAIEAVLPSLLAGTFQREIDALDPTTRSALEIASLAGATFTSSSVASVWNVNVTVVEQLLAPLGDRGHIIRTEPGSPRSYAFRHPAYADLLARHAPFTQQMRAAAAFDHHDEPQRLRA